MCESSGFNLFSSETGKVFNNNPTNFTFLSHSLHTLEVTSFKTCTGNPVIYKEHCIFVAVIFTIIKQDLFLPLATTYTFPQSRTVSMVAEDIIPYGNKSEN